ncbi:SDR family oxidoreductase [Sulfitobacter geojensis]|uniref:SDR family oxidoreductase n=1 Tax=Sulfitobacter geojensis TaxID=1342299 RepID=UPI000A49F840|nr:SDR family oxidoreductase [Sulfitobacter geojensis]
MNVLDNFSLAGKTALVTGAKRGIGLGMAEALAQAGADIIGVSASLDPAGSDVGNAVEALGRKFTGYACDFSDRAAVKAFTAKVVAENPQIDILINNAGTILRTPAAEHPDEMWDKVIEVNLNAQFIITRDIGKTMVERGSGKMIFFYGVSANVSRRYNCPGLRGLQRWYRAAYYGLRKRMGSKGVNVNAIAPGYIDTDNTEALRNDPERSSTILSRIPAGRWGKPIDFAGPAVFLSSEASSYMHGHIMLVDGGWMGR